VIVPASFSDGGLVLRLVGEFAVLRAGRPLAPAAVGSRKARALLKLLGVERDCWVSLDQVVEVVWAGAAPQRPAEYVATIVSRLRSNLGEGVVEGGRDGYRLGRLPVVEVDLAIAERYVTEAQLRMAGGEATLAWVAASVALATLGDGPVLVADTNAGWADMARAEAVSLLRAAREVGAAAALTVGDAASARDLANAAVKADGLDEQACRQLMRAEVVLGEPGRAVAAYQRLRLALASELGVDPSRETRDLHVAILREEPPANRAGLTAPGRPKNVTPAAALVGRDAVLNLLTRRWSSAAGGSPGLALITGEAGIGKTRLAAELAGLAARTGGLVLRARCYEAERSLFLQPIIETLGEHAATADPSTIRAAAGAWAGPVSSLVPQIAAIVEPVLPQHDDGEVAQRRAYDAFSQYVCRLATRPVLLLIDDLHLAGLATVELLHYLVRRAGMARLLVVATVRADEGATVLASLADVGERVELGPLSAEAVTKLATAAGHGELSASIAARTGGHTLFVVETLQALTAGEAGIPESLQAAVLLRIRRAGDQVEKLLRAAAVLGSAIEPENVARMLDVSTVAASAGCERALAARLLVVAARSYEFANDLIREVVYNSMPPPTRVAFHRLAADLQGDRPESIGAHAAAAGDWPRAGRAWLLAGEQASARVAYADAEVLLTHAIDAAERSAEPEVAGRAYLARGHVREAMATYPEALADLETAVDLAHQTGDRRLEMRALRELANDVTTSLGGPVTRCVPMLHSGLTIAEALGDRANEADLLARLAVIACNRLEFTQALEYGRRAAHAARASGDDRALALALDGLKTGYAYLGEIEPLAVVLAELEPLLRRQGDLWRLSWTIQESAFPAVASQRWDEALARHIEALEVNQRSGYIAYEGWFVGQIGWVHRLRGQLAEAVAYGRRAVELTRDSAHAWWRSAACTQLARTLLVMDNPTGAVELLHIGREYASQEGAEAYLLNCLATLAEATGDRAVLEQANALLTSIDVPTGGAWMLGAEAYLGLGRAWLAHDEPALALSTVDPLFRAADRIGWIWVREAAAELMAEAGVDGRPDQSSSARKAAARSAPPVSTGR
jgi:DNA-binding SARP family transcriptional activator/tetratricopeptide (TPR) repeat protein